jgi:Zn-dependent protease with chaperone function
MSMRITDDSGSSFTSDDLIDKPMEALFSNIIVDKLFKKISNIYCDSRIGVILNSSEKVTIHNAPMLYSLFCECCRIVEIKNKPELYITNAMKGVNALSVMIEGKTIILISRKAIVNLNNKEIRFILGHELGHVAQNNMACHMIHGLLLNSQISDSLIGIAMYNAIEVPLNRWCRQMEFNADRIGYLCCQDFETIEMLFNKIGFNTSYYSQYLELFKAHPLAQNRLLELKRYILEKS